jgi:hypothetical protein
VGGDHLHAFRAFREVDFILGDGAVAIESKATENPTSDQPLSDASDLYRLWKSDENSDYPRPYLPGQESLQCFGSGEGRFDNLNIWLLK